MAVDALLDGVKRNFVEDEILKSNYFCKVERKETVDTVLELHTSSKTPREFVKFRYVLVIDVSASMDQKAKNSKETLLDRIKTFATACVGSLSNTSWLSIITFSKDANVEMEMTRMDFDGKNQAKEIIAGLHSQSSTNLSGGLLKGLSSTRGGEPGIRDSIILFTDGEANHGITNVDLLVEKYNSLSSDLGKTSRVPVSAFTIGNYEPHFLREIAERLGSEAFYWLNENCKFEADMFAPICLRESTSITDISIRLRCRQGVKFDLSDLSTEFLECDPNAPSAATELKYFFHIIPPETKKHVCFRLTLPSESLDGERILTITKTCMDFDGRLLSWTEHLELRVKSIFDILPSERRGLDELADEIQRNTAAYSMRNNTVNYSLRSAESSLLKVLLEECRLITALTLKRVCYLFRNTNKTMNKKGNATHYYDETLDKIRNLQNQANAALGSKSHFFEEFCSKADLMERIIESLNKRIKYKSINWGQLASMESSLSSEMPTSSGVFDRSIPQPFMPGKVRSKIEILREALVENTGEFDEMAESDDSENESERVEVRMENWISKICEFLLTCLFLFFILFRSLLRRFV